jgi:serine/threonine protein kinase
VHRDIKPENILLAYDDHRGSLTAKIGNFSAAKILHAVGRSHSNRSTLTVVGTNPYMPIEYLQQGHLSDKTDAFAFGVVLLELLTAKPPSSSGEFLYSELSSALRQAPAALPPLLDRRAGKWPRDKALALAAIAQKCLEMFARDRVAVRDVLVELDVLAGREALRRAGRGEEYHPMTGKLVKTA